MEPAPPPPSSALLWAWTGVRALWIALLPFSVGLLALLAGINEAASGRWMSALKICLFGLAGLALAAVAGRYTWQVHTRRRQATATALTSEILTSSVLLTGLLLLFLIVAPYFSGIFRRSGEGAMKNRLADLRGRVSAYRASHGGQAPPSLDDLGEIPKLWGSYVEVPHKPAAAALVLPDAAPTDSGKWAYVISVASPALTGAVFIDCTHTDFRGSSWTAY
jgi:hypothetical protein